MKTKKQLEKIIKDAKEELWEREAAEKLKNNKKLVGQCFRYHNCYSCPKGPEDYWWTYKQIIHLRKDGDLVGFEFQIDSEKKASVEIDEWSHIDSWQPISRELFESEWQKLKDYISDTKERVCW